MTTCGTLCAHNGWSVGTTLGLQVVRDGSYNGNSGLVLPGYAENKLDTRHGLEAVIASLLEKYPCLELHEFGSIWQVHASIQRATRSRACA